MLCTVEAQATTASLNFNFKNLCRLVEIQVIEF